MSDDPSANDVAELLTASCTWGEVNLLEDYLVNGAEPNQKNKKGDTPLHVACLYGEIECANTLLTYKGKRLLEGKEFVSFFIVSKIIIIYNIYIYIYIYIIYIYYNHLYIHLLSIFVICDVFFFFFCWRRSVEREW